MNNFPSWIVIKFGGTSVSTLDRWRLIARIAKKHATTHRVLIVCSALTGITNQLEQLIIAAKQNQHHELLQEIIDRYQALSHELDVDFDLVSNEIIKLKNLTTGISLIQDCPPNTNAKILAMGEIILTLLGSNFLNKNDVATSWCDARQYLKSIPQLNGDQRQHFLQAVCDYHPDPQIQLKLQQFNTPIVITQGFIASNDQDDTVILGRGGSDTSAAYFASKLNAIRCEIWTDVPGIYTANPHEIKEARLLKSLDYDEAQEIASMGAKVLHPHCLAPLKINQIPLFVGCTDQPDEGGTEISIDGRHREIPIKSILTKHDLTLVQIESMQMWQQVGFLADIFTCFKRRGLSIDLISTSESTVTVSLDRKINHLDSKALDHLLNDLNSFSKATAIGPCTAISIVGQNIRSILHKLGSAFKLFEEQKVYLISQAANDLNLTFVVDETQALRLAQQLHTLLILDYQTVTPSKNYFPIASQSGESTYKSWWHHHQEILLNAAKKESPLYVYDEDTVNQSIQALKSMTAIDRVFYSIKANHHSAILKQVHDGNFGFECVSIGELRYLLKQFPSLDRRRVLFTPNFAPKSEYAEAILEHVLVTVDNLHPLQHWPELFTDQEIILRFDPGKGYGHHHYVCTGGFDSKFGIPFGALPELKKLIKQHRIRVIGLHAHLGSGIFDPQTWRDTALFLTQLIPDFTETRLVNVGGGLGVIEKSGESGLDLLALNQALLTIKQLHPQLEFWLEPGRFIVSEAGVILSQVTQLKQKGETRYIGIDCGMNSLIRPALYGAYHNIVNLSRLDEPRNTTAHIVGPICESGDTLGFSRLMPASTMEGDILLIANAGAYGHVMSSHYNLRQPAKEYSLQRDLLLLSDHAMAP